MRIEMSEPDYKQLLLQFIGSLTMCDHMGDVGEDVEKVLKLAKIDIDEWEDWSDLRNSLGKMGVTTLYGTELGSDDE